MRDWLHRIREHLSAGRVVVSVTATAVQGSAPCAPGARMLYVGGAIEGTVGGGNLEFTAIDQARKLAAAGKRATHQSLPLGPLLAQCCGGRVDLAYERFSPADLPFFDRIQVDQGEVITAIGRDRYGKWSNAASGITPIAGSDWTQPPALSSLHDVNWRETWREAAPLVCIFGGGHIGAALLKVLEVTSCEVAVIDPRKEIALPPVSNAVLIGDSAPGELGGWWRPGAIAVVLTHSHEQDYLWISALLRRGDPAYCGLIGSRTKRTRFLRRLTADGLSETQIARLTCPIGLPDMNSKLPGAVAISVAAQILPFLAVLSPARRGRSSECAPPANNRKESLTS